MLDVHFSYRLRLSAAKSDFLVFLYTILLPEGHDSFFSARSAEKMSMIVCDSLRLSAAKQNKKENYENTVC